MRENERFRIGRACRNVHFKNASVSGPSLCTGRQRGTAFQEGARRKNASKHPYAVKSWNRLRVVETTLLIETMLVPERHAFSCHCISCWSLRSNALVLDCRKQIVSSRHHDEKETVFLVGSKIRSLAYSKNTGSEVQTYPVQTKKDFKPGPLACKNEFFCKKFLLRQRPFEEKLASKMSKLACRSLF